MENCASRNPFSKIKGRFLAILWIFPFSYLPGFSGFLETFSQVWPWYWIHICYAYLFHAAFFLTLFVLATKSGLNWEIFFQKRVTSKGLIPGLKLTVFLFIFSSATGFVIFFPLSYMFPQFVDRWYIQAYEIIFSDGQSYPIFSNLLSFISVIAIAPLLEEAAFRGILFHRWAYKWNTTRAMIFSSVLFGIVHREPISATLFGIGMCVLYVRTHSLFIPILCHSLNNFVAWLVEAGYSIVYGPTYQYTLERFQNEWSVGIICGIISIAWIFLYLRKPVDIKKYSLSLVK